MPNDFTQGKNAGNKSMSLNLDALGEAANQSVQGNSGETPVLNEEVEATVVNTDFRMMSDLHSNQNNPELKYYNTIFAVETDFEYKDANGEMVEATSRDNYGGIRVYPKINEQGEVMNNASGQPVIQRMWVGDNSAAGRLFALVQKADKSVRSYTDFFNFFNKEGGVRVTIKSQQTSYNGQTKNKLIIQSIL